MTIILLLQNLFCLYKDNFKEGTIKIIKSFGAYDIISEIARCYFVNNRRRPFHKLRHMLRRVNGSTKFGNM